MKANKGDAPSNSIDQIVAMQANYPSFTYSRLKGKEVEFRGKLQAREDFPIYEVSILYSPLHPPQVRVISPALVENPPHIYRKERTLCLYRPDNYEWTNQEIITTNILPWTGAWIYFYEIWLRTGVWYGPEAAHDNIKKTA
ncbi:MAG: hypothetical protein JST76_07320 [Bacteroidetes bacterium]|nr:hypothetical protein [Bacteroidota bacterium]